MTTSVGEVYYYNSEVFISFISWCGYYSQHFHSPFTQTEESTWIMPECLVGLSNERGNEGLQPEEKPSQTSSEQQQSQPMKTHQAEAIITHTEEEFIQGKYHDPFLARLVM